MNTRTTTSTGTAPPPTADTQAGNGTERHALVADDGRHLAASWFEPPAGRARAVAVISSAAGVPRGFYRAFAQWLAERGYAVLTYDYRGIAGSRRGHMREEPATMADWALLDMSAALAAAQARRTTEALPLLLIGHSFGGNAIGFARGVEQADALLTVASQLGEPRLFPGVHRAVAEFFFRAWVPAVVGFAGYLPGWALGPGAQAVPAGVARQWAAWGRLRGWAFADPAMRTHRAASAVVVPVHLWNVSDDLTYAPPGAVDALAEKFRNAAVQRHTVRPHEVGVRRLGHFGAFRREPGPRLWQRLLDQIEEAAPHCGPERGAGRTALHCAGVTPATPPPAFANEAAARRVLLLHALETGSADNPLWTTEDARWATRVARETVPADAGPVRFLDERAQHALQRLQPRDADLRRMVARRGWRWWWLPAALLLGAALGVSIDIFGGGQRINLLAPTVWAVVAWNLLVYVSLLLPRPRRLPKWLALRLAGRGAGGSARLQFQQAWAAHAAPLLLARAALLLHAVAAAVALGLIAGLYLRGLVLDYRAGWQSTFLDADQLRLFLSTVLGPAVTVTGINLPDAAGLQALRVGPDGAATASAAPWIHLFAATLALFVVLPRGVLMVWAAVRSAWLARRLRLPVHEPYFQRLLFEHRGQAARVQLLTHGAAPSPHAQACVRALLEQALLGQGLQMSSAAPVPYGSEETAASSSVEPGTTLRVLLLELSATPEEDSHGALVRALRGPALPPLLLLVDESAFKQRFAGMPARIAERRQAWQRWAKAQGVPLVCADLAQPDFAQAREALEEALR